MVKVTKKQIQNTCYKCEWALHVNEIVIYCRHGQKCAKAHVPNTYNILEQRKRNESGESE